MGPMKCDFCSDTPVVATYPVSQGTPWAACEPCSRLVELGDRKALARRAGKALGGMVPLVLAMEKAEQMQAELFWDVRESHAR
jgi:hypothetical protein